MRNIVIAFFLGITLIWLFFTVILLDGSSDDEPIATISERKSALKNSNIISADIENMALLLGVEYEAENIAENPVDKLAELDVEVGIVVIFTSENMHKVRLRTVIDKEKAQRDMIIGESLYNYVLTAINPSSVEFSSGEENIILKAFEDTVISVSDLPKELP